MDDPIAIEQPRNIGDEIRLEHDHFAARVVLRVGGSETGVALAAAGAGDRAGKRHHDDESRQGEIHTSAAHGIPPATFSQDSPEPIAVR
jgi:hypothetical protein